jgi:hypothetical protein
MSRREGKTTEAVLQVYQQLVPVQPTTLKVFNFSTKPKKKLVSSFQHHLLNLEDASDVVKGIHLPYHTQAQSIASWISKMQN